MRLVLFLTTLLVTVGTLLPIIREQSWWIRILDFPRVQILVLQLVTLLAYLILWPSLKSWEVAFMIILVAAIGYQIFRIYPYTPLAARQVVDAGPDDPSNTVSLLISNVLMTNRKSDEYRDMLCSSQPDIVFVAEADGWWEKQLQQIEQDYPFSLKYPLDNTYGMLLYSKLELQNAQVKFLVEKNVPSMHFLVRLPSGQLVALHCLHPKPPYPSESNDTEERDAELLIVGKAAEKSSEPTIVAGDLNDVAWSHTTRLFQRISGLLDPRIGRGLYNSFHAEYPLIRFPLDHIFHSHHFKLVQIERKGYFGSDHFPIHVSLVYQPGAPFQQDEPESHREDGEDAEERIEQGQH